MHHRIVLAASAALALTAGACFAQSASTSQTSGTSSTSQQVQTVTTTPDLKLDTSVIYARGSYGLPTDTDIWMALVTPTLETSDWRLQVAVPYLWLKGPASAAGSVGATPASRRESGLGDVAVTGTWKFPVLAGGWYTSASAKIKFPTADDAKGLGTGQTDAAFQVDVTRKFGDLTPYGTLGYQFLGRSALYPMKNGAFVTVGFLTSVSDQTMMGLAGNWRQPTFDGGKSAEELMLFVQQKITDASHLQLFLLHGFTDASPDVAVGATYGWKF